jgi:hypothetical protein
VIIPLAVFAPDASPFDNTTSDNILNVVPTPDGYGPMPQLVTFTNALAAQPRGAFPARTTEGAIKIFAATSSNFYLLDATDGTWDTVTGALTPSLPADEIWSFTQIGDRVIVTCTTEGPYYFDLASSVAFVALPGSPPSSRCVTTIGDFVVLGEVESNPKQLRWSGINDTEHWAVRQRLADIQTFPDGNFIMAVVGFERGGLIFQRNAVREMIPAYDTPLVFRFQKTEENRGAVSSAAVASSGRDVFYLSDDGFYAYGQPSRNIGAQRVNKFFVEDSKPDLTKDVQGAIDPVSQTVWWRYSSVGNDSTVYTDKMIGYNWAIDRWTLVEVNLTWIMGALGPGYTLEGLDSISSSIDALPYSLDSAAWKGGAPLLGAFDSTYKFGFFDGQPMEAVLQTGDVHLPTMTQSGGDERRAFVRGFQPMCDASSVTGRVADKTRAGATRVWNAEATANTNTGMIPARSDGLYHRFEVTIAADQTWTSIHGVQPDVRTGGRR